MAGTGRAHTTTYGIVGLGYWGPNLLRVLNEQPGADVRWICDRDQSRLERYGQRYPHARATTEYQTLLDDDEVDALVIATPVFTHFDLAARSLRAGKHTFVEKPLAASVREAEQLMSMADEEGRVLMCGHTFLYSPAVNAVRRFLDEGILGEVYFISSSRVNLGLHQRDVSVVWDLAPHDFSILLHWLDEVPVTVRAVGRDSIVRGIPDVAFVTLKYASGIVANVELSWLAPSKLRRTVVVGSNKMVVYDDSGSEPIRLFDTGVVYEDPETFGEYQLSYRSGDILSPRLDTYEPLAAEMADFGRLIAEGRPDRSHAALARDVVRLVEAADKSLRNGGREVAIDPVAQLSRFGRRSTDVPLTQSA